MELARAIVGLGVTFAPVPGLTIAFETLNFIWENVQKASTNKEALKNLVLSTAEILIAIDRALSHSGTFNEHIRALLRNLEKVLDDFLEFAEKHVSKSLVRILIRNVDVVGKIEQFQRRMQSLLVAFNIAALGSIDNQLDRLLQGQHAASKGLPPPSTNQCSGSSPESQLDISPITDYEPVHVHASFSDPSTITLVKGAPVLTCPYFPSTHLDAWGIREPDSLIVHHSTDSFTTHQGTNSWTWTLAWKEIRVEPLTLGFPSERAARAWFVWLRAYAQSRGSVTPPPASCDVWLRRMYKSLMQKTLRRIERQPTCSSMWITVHGGVLQSRSVYATHLTYTQAGPLPIRRAYRSGDTLVIERLNCEEDEEPVAARRYRFDSEELARRWYKAWEDCVVASPSGGSESVQVEHTVNGPVTLQLRGDIPILASPLLPDEQLSEWGVHKRNASLTYTAVGFDVATLAASWSWSLAENKVTVYAALTSQPDLCDILELSFHSVSAAGTWFAYLAVGSTESPPPRPEPVTLKKTRACLMQHTGNSIDTRNAMSGAWRPLFGGYARITPIYPADIIATTAGGAHHTFTREGCALCVDKDNANIEVGAAVREKYVFTAETNAEVWEDRWRAHVMHQMGG